jgi:hypothetical protein
MYPTNNLRVRNAHSSRSASPIRFSCPHCHRTFSSIPGRKQHIRAIHSLPTRDTNSDDVPLHEPSPSLCSAGPHPHSPSPFVDALPPIDGGSPSGGSTSFSRVFTHAEQEQHTPHTPSSQNYRVTVEDITDDEDDAASSQSPSSHHSYNDFNFGEEPDFSPRRETPSVHCSEPKITRTYHPDLTGMFLITLSSDLI